MNTSNKRGQAAIIVKGYPRLHETGIAQEIFALEQGGISLDIWALDHPGEQFSNPIHKKITASVFYYPKALHKAPMQFLKAFCWSCRQKNFIALMRVFSKDWRRDFTIKRLRTFGQALIMAHALPETTKHIHACFLGSPSTLACYAALLTNRTWSFSAHDKDLQGIRDWEKKDKINSATWGGAFSEQDVIDLLSLTLDTNKISLLQQHIDASFFSPPPPSRPTRNGMNSNDPIRLISVGRVHSQKGLYDLIRALAALPKNFYWQYVHIGGGAHLTKLKQLAQDHQVENRILFLGPRNQTDILTLLREADLFVLPTIGSLSGRKQLCSQDRPPKVVLEAASQRLAILATSLTRNLNFISPNKEGVLVPPNDWESLSNAINLLGRDPQQRSALGEAAYQRLQAYCLQENQFDTLVNHFRNAIGSS